MLVATLRWSASRGHSSLSHHPPTPPPAFGPVRRGQHWEREAKGVARISLGEMTWRGFPEGSFSWSGLKSEAGGLESSPGRENYF